MPFIIFSAVAFIAYKVLYPLAPPMGIHYFVDVPFLCAILSDYGSWSGRFLIGEEERVIRDVPL